MVHHNNKINSNPRPILEFIVIRKFQFKCQIMPRFRNIRFSNFPKDQHKILQINLHYFESHYFLLITLTINHTKIQC